MWWWNRSVSRLCFPATVSGQGALCFAEFAGNYRREKLQLYNIGMFRALRDGQAMYEIGSPCASDADCTLHTPATCNLDDRLCVLDITTTPIPTTLAPTSSQSSTSEPILSTTATVHSPTTTTTGNAHVNPGIYAKLEYNPIKNVVRSILVGRGQP